MCLIYSVAYTLLDILYSQKDFHHRGAEEQRKKHSFFNNLQLCVSFTLWFILYKKFCILENAFHHRGAEEQRKHIMNSLSLF